MQAHTQDQLHTVLPLLCCPGCAGELVFSESEFGCDSCAGRFPIVDGIPLLAKQGTAETWGETTDGETSQRYQLQYTDPAEARSYNQAYDQKLFKRWTTAKERRLLDRLLASQERCATLLDLPCGGGRLSAGFDKYTDCLIEADTGRGQLMYGRETAPTTATRVWMTASAFHIPFKDESVDGVICCRLNHHLPTRTERERLVSELLRVARGFVIMSFFDHRSLKNTLRRVRQPLNRKPPKLTMTVERVAELARKAGADLVACPPLAVLSSGHRYALLRKRSRR